MKKVLELLNAARNFGKCRLFPGLLVTSLLFLMSGCGESRVAVYQVEGNVSFDGQPPVGALVVFHPEGHTLPEGDVAIGTVKDDGKFEVNIYGNGGIPAGNYVATIQWRKLVESEGGFGSGPNVIPEKYSSPDTSPVKVTVKEGANVLDPIVIGKS